MTQEASALEWLLDYEMRTAARYRRFVSVVMVASASDIGNVGVVVERLCAQER